MEEDISNEEEDISNEEEDISNEEEDISSEEESFFRIDEDPERIIRRHQVSWQLPAHVEDNDIDKVNENGNSDKSQHRRIINNYQYKLYMTLSINYESNQMKDVYADLLYNDSSIGYLKGTIIPRPCRGRFFELSDMISGELHWLACLFCDKNGRVCQIETDLDEEGVTSGGFFHIDEVSVEKSHKGKDVGLRVIHETLAFVREYWTIVVLQCSLLNRGLEDRLGRDLDKSDEDLDLQRTLTLKLRRHIARMGFKQAGRNADECNAWYMSSKAYFGDDQTSESLVAINRWKTKEETESLDIYVVEHLKGVHKELQDVIKNDFLVHQQYVINHVEDLVQNEGASLQKSQALFILLASGSISMKDNTYDALHLLKTLIRLGADVNVQDEKGNTPLHFATRGCFIKALIDAGADVSKVNSKGHTPLQSLQESWKRRQDFRSAFFRNHSGVLPGHLILHTEAMLVLLPTNIRSLLIDDWLSPRLMKMFQIQVETTLDFFLEPRECDIYPTKNLISISDLVVSSLFHFDFIPTEVLRSNLRGFHMKFINGWGVVWLAIFKAMRKKKAPTIKRIQKEIMIMDTDAIESFEYFKQKGGKIDYALDAIIWTAKDVNEDEDIQEEVGGLPMTPFDDLFDVARIKLLDMNELLVFRQRGGPYDISEFFDD